MPSATHHSYRWLNQNLLFWCLLATWSLLPGRLVPIWNVGGTAVKGTDCLLVLAAVSMATLWLVRLHPMVTFAARSRLVIVSFCVTLLYAALSISWSGLDANGSVDMLCTLIAAGSAAVLAYGVIGNKCAKEVHTFLGRLATFIAIVSGVYLLDSMFSLGLHGDTAISSSDFGIARMGGPLFEASTGYFLLIPALAFYVEETLAGRTRPLYGLLGCFSLVLSLLALGSRAGLLMLGLFMIIVIVLQHDFVRRLVVGAIVVAVAVCALAIIFSRATTDRLQSFEDEDRAENYRAAVTTMEGRGVLANIGGSGYGSIWPWYTTERRVRWGNLYENGLPSRTTTSGIFLMHAHSTILGAVVELGIVGGVFVIVLLISLAALVARAFSAGQFRIFAAGIACSALSLGFDLFLFRRPTRDVAWWVFLFGASALIGKAHSHSKTRHCGRGQRHSMR